MALSLKRASSSVDSSSSKRQCSERDRILLQHIRLARQVREENCKPHAALYKALPGVKKHAGKTSFPNKLKEILAYKPAEELEEAPHTKPLYDGLLYWDCKYRVVVVRQEGPSEKCGNLSLNDLLPLHFSHNKYGSFKRQLEIYGFTDCTSQLIEDLGDTVLFFFVFVTRLEAKPFLTKLFPTMPGSSATKTTPTSPSRTTA